MSNEQIIEEASEWLVTLRTELPDAAVHRRFMAWLQASPEHVRAYLGIATLWADLAAVDPQRTTDAHGLVERARAVSNVVGVEAVSPFNGEGALASSVLIASAKRSVPGHRKLRSSFALAASVAFACIAAGLLGTFALVRPMSYETGIGEQRVLRLDDGSTVKMNSDSRMRVHFSDSGRDVELLAGQALFQVAKDPGRPFVVRSGATQVRAVGTQFDVYRKKAGTVITVIEGRVAVRPAEHNLLVPKAETRTIAKELLLSAGEQLTVTPASSLRSTRANIAAATAWTQGQLMFKSAPLSTVIEEFNRYSSQRLVLSDSIEDFPITAVFSSTDPSMLLEFLQSQPDLDVRKAEGKLLIVPRAETPPAP